jgi:hypothetical protein
MRGHKMEIVKHKMFDYQGKSGKERAHFLLRSDKNLMFLVEPLEVVPEGWNLKDGIDSVLRMRPCAMDPHDEKRFEDQFARSILEYKGQEVT